MSEHTEAALRAILNERVAILDGAMGTMIQRRGLEEADFRGERFADYPSDLKGNNDLLSLTRPDVIREIHQAYFEAGADMVETNTFNAQAVSLADYQMEALAYELNVAAARVACEARDAVMARDGQPRFVAGAIGPTNRTLSLSPDVNQPGYRAITFDALREAYLDQVLGLIEGGVDTLLVETIFDTLNAKAALFAIEEAFEQTGVRLPVMISVTITDASGRTLSGQTVEAFWSSIAHARPFSVGINCALGPVEMRPYMGELSRLADTFVSCYPNAGLPNAFGGYDLSPDQMAAILTEYASAGWLNLVGGCCGTTPAHIRAIAQAMRTAAPRAIPEVDDYTRYSGLEALVIRPDANFIMIGERTNVTGSRKFERLIKNGLYEEAIEVARQQVDGGANVIDINMDEGMIDAVGAMTTFLNIVATEPEVARVPIMIDSSRFEALEAGLKCVQGKAIVNSISLKEGEASFKRQARIVRRYGAAVVVMAFDEQGQADTRERKVAICQRAYTILTAEVGFDPRDIIFDPNILTVATGIEEHNDYAIHYIEAVREIKRLMPQVKTVGGVSNISFSFRGNDRVREAIHASFLYHAIGAGLDMGIVNAGQLEVYEEIEPVLLEHVEDVLFNRRPDATERLVTLAESYHGEAGKKREIDDAWRSRSLEDRLAHALMKGIDTHLEEDLTEAMALYARPLDIIEGPLMRGMGIVGDLFGQGKMFLPQVVKSARAMKKAVSHLLPFMTSADGQQSRYQGRILLATVKGDVHDIGKNIVGVVLGCNNYEVIDLGVMVPWQDILAAAREHQVDIIGLSGLITPSLDEMVTVAKELEREGFTTPLLIGGATTSRKHTSIKIAPAYSGPTAHVLDASRVVAVVGGLLSPERRDAYMRENEEIQARDRQLYAGRGQRSLLTFPEAQARRGQLDFSPQNLATPAFFGTREVTATAAELAPYIDWTPFFITWGFRDVYPQLLDDPGHGEAARELFENAKVMLQRLIDANTITGRGVYGFFPAQSDGEDILLYETPQGGAVVERLCTLRQQRARPGDESSNLCLADFIAPVSSGQMDSMGAFAVAAGLDMDDMIAQYEAAQDDYNVILLKSLADRLAEAFAERLHEQARADWGYGADEALSCEDLIKERYRGVRPAPGYPACPDHTEKRKLWTLLSPTERASITLTESCAMHPAAAVSGWYFAHPQSRYFSVGLIGQDQVEAYAARKDMPVAEVERWLAQTLGYEPT